MQLCFRASVLPFAIVDGRLFFDRRCYIEHQLVIPDWPAMFNSALSTRLEPRRTSKVQICRSVQVEICSYKSDILLSLWD